MRSKRGSVEGDDVVISSPQHLYVLVLFIHSTYLNRVGNMWSIGILEMRMEGGKSLIALQSKNKRFWLSAWATLWCFRSTITKDRHLVVCPWT